MNTILLPRTTPLRELRLEDAIAEAATLGRVSMDQAFDLEWRCSISFNNRNGSYISAGGRDRSLIIALGKCIDEARELGAGVAP